MPNNDLTTRKSSDIAAPDILWLKNLDNDRVIPWTPLLAVRPRFVNCNEDGEVVVDVAGDHPWIKEQTKELYNMMSSAGANPDTLQDMGRQLIADMEAKTRLTDKRQKQQKLTQTAHTLIKSSLAWIISRNPHHRYQKRESLL